MDRLLFFSFTLLLVGTLFNLFVFTGNIFDDNHLAKIEAEITYQKLRRTELNKEMLVFQFEAFKSEVSSLLPKKFNKVTPENYQLRNLASVTRTVDQNDLAAALDKKYFQQGKKLFLSRAFKSAQQKLIHFIDDYSYSKDVVEAYSMLVEASYQLGQFKKSVNYIETMVDQFPHHELTGYSLLRLSVILKKQNQTEKSGGILTAVMQSFREYPLIREKARAALRQL